MKRWVDAFFSSRVATGLLAFVSVPFYLSCVGATSVSWRGLVIAFALIWGVYLENLTTDRREDEGNGAAGPRRSWGSLRGWLYVGAALVALSMGVVCFIGALAVLLIGLGYSHPWFPTPRGPRRLKEFFIVKNIVPPMGWLIAVGVIPFVASGVRFHASVLPFFLMMFLFFFREEIKFDIPDAAGDLKAGIRTLPNTWGEASTRRALNFINYALTLLLFGSLLIFWERGETHAFGGLLKNSIPLLTAFVYDQNFTQALFEKKQKELCNVGIVWWVVLLAVYLALPYPGNIGVFVALVFAGSSMARIFGQRGIGRKV